MCYILLSGCLHSDGVGFGAGFYDTTTGLGALDFEYRAQLIVTRLLEMN